MLPNDSLDPLFLATVQSTEEAIVNAMVAAETMTGIDDHTAIALPARPPARGSKEIQPPGKIRSPPGAGTSVNPPVQAERTTPGNAPGVKPSTSRLAPRGSLARTDSRPTEDKTTLVLWSRYLRSPNRKPPRFGRYNSFSESLPNRAHQGGMKFTCTHCTHSVSTLEFDAKSGNLRTQAATAINDHAAKAHHEP
jgi:hypothetical protein